MNITVMCSTQLGAWGHHLLGGHRKDWSKGGRCCSCDFRVLACDHGLQDADMLCLAAAGSVSETYKAC
jgi:hypothetical protein